VKRKPLGQEQLGQKVRCGQFIAAMSSLLPTLIAGVDCSCCSGLWGSQVRLCLFHDRQTCGGAVSMYIGEQRLSVFWATARAYEIPIPTSRISSR